MKIGLLCLITFVSSVAWAAGDGIPVGTVVTQLANLSILLGVLFFFTRKGISQAFREKRENFLQSVESASKSKQDAEDQLKEVKERLQNLTATAEAQLAEAKKNAEEHYRVQVSDARNNAEKLKSMALTSIDYEVQRQVENLRVETFQKSAGIAEKQMENSLSPEQLKIWNARFSKAEGAH